MSASHPTDAPTIVRAANGTTPDGADVSVTTYHRTKGGNSFLHIDVTCTTSNPGGFASAEGPLLITIPLDTTIIQAQDGVIPTAREEVDAESGNIVSLKAIPQQGFSGNIQVVVTFQNDPSELAFFVRTVVK